VAELVGEQLAMLFFCPQYRDIAGLDENSGDAAFGAACRLVYEIDETVLLFALRTPVQLDRQVLCDERITGLENTVRIPMKPCRITSGTASATVLPMISRPTPIIE
jgi:hypothetical protein